MTTLEYMDALKIALNARSDYALAQKMGITQPATSKWRQGKAGIGDEHAPLIAQILNRPVQQVLADLHAEREKSPELRKIWQSISLNYAVRACIICMLAMFNITLAPRTAEAATPVFFGPDVSVYKFPLIWIKAICRNLSTLIGHFFAAPSYR